MLIMVTGVMGGGKGVTTINAIVRELETSCRPILTNFAIRKEPWVTSDFQMRLGLEAYLTKRWQGNRVKAKEAVARVYFLTDEQAQCFFLYRVRDGKVVQADCTYRTDKDGEKRVVDFDATDMNETGGCLYVIDEAWKFFNARDWQKTGYGVLFYVRQHRKASDDVIICTQLVGDIDKAIRGVCQEFWHCNNRGMRSVGRWLRQPDDFRVNVYTEPPTGGQLRPMRVDTFKLDKDMCGSYDTSAGVGFGGGIAADTKRKRRGLPFWSIYVLGALGIVAFWFLSTYGMRAGTKAIAGTAERGNNAAGKIATNMIEVASPNLLHNGVQGGRQSSLMQVTNEPPPVEVTAMLGQGKGAWVVYLSDGRVLHSSQGHFSLITTDGVRMGTNWYGLRRSAPVQKTNSVFGYNYVMPSYQQPFTVTGIRSEPPQIKSDVILFGRRPATQKPAGNPNNWFRGN